jgi:hypothetical protein
MSLCFVSPCLRVGADGALFNHSVTVCVIRPDFGYSNLDAHGKHGSFSGNIQGEQKPRTCSATHYSLKNSQLTD